MAFNNGAVIPGRRPSIKKNTKVVRPPKPQIEKPVVSIADIGPVKKEEVVVPQPEVIIANEPTQEEINIIQEEALGTCPYTMVVTIIPESPVEEASIMETNEVEIEDEPSEEETEETEEMEVEEKKLSKWERKKNKKNKKKATVAYEPKQEE